MRADSLWYEVHTTGRVKAHVSLRRCSNCGEVKVLTRPCSLDHLAAILEFKAQADFTPTTDAPEETTT